MELARPRFDSPTRYLFYHSIELYLKAFLRNSGLTVREIKGKSHGFCALCAACTERGLEADEGDRQVIGLINAQGNYIRARYIETGLMRVASLEALSQTGGSLAVKIGGALKGSGVPVREPRPSPLKLDSQQIPADLSEEDRLIIELAGELIDGDIEPRNAQDKSNAGRLAPPRLLHCSLAGRRCEITCAQPAVAAPIDVTFEVFEPIGQVKS